MVPLFNLFELPMLKIHCTLTRNQSCPYQWVHVLCGLYFKRILRRMSHLKLAFHHVQAGMQGKGLCRYSLLWTLDAGCTSPQLCRKDAPIL